MFVLPYLNNREIGTKPRPNLGNRKLSLDVDDLILRLICYKKNVFVVNGEENEEVPPFSCKFRRDQFSDLLAVSNEDGFISLYNTSDEAGNSVLTSFAAHSNAVFDICWLNSSNKMITASGDHLACMWDMHSCSKISNFASHIASVKSVDVCPSQDAVFATGSRDGNICVWDTRDISSTLRPSIKISNAHCRKPYTTQGRKHIPSSSVSSVAFQDSNNLASAGAADGIVKIWDLRKTYISQKQPVPRYQLSYTDTTSGHGCTSLVFDSTYKTLYTCTTNNRICKFDCHLYVKEEAEYEGLRCDTYFVKLALSCDDQYLLCGSSYERAYIWKTSKPGLPIAELPGHEAEVTSVAWNLHDITKAVTCGDDNRVLVWKIGDPQHEPEENVYASASTYVPINENYDSMDQLIITDEGMFFRPAKQDAEKQTNISITDFFSPITPVVHKPCLNLESPMDDDYNLTANIFGSHFSKTPFPHITAEDIFGSNFSENASSSIASSSSVLTTCDNSFKCVLHRSNTETPVKHSEPQSIFAPSTSKQNKENAVKDNKNENKNGVCAFGSVKRKVSKSSLPRKPHSVKSTPKNKKQKSSPGRTIMNYFSVQSSSEDTT